jgi:TolB protein
MLPPLLAAGLACVAASLLASSAPAADLLIRNTLPAVSPDGLHIAFVSNRDSLDAIWVIDVDGTHERRVTPDGVAGTSPAWSADGTKIRFAGTGVDTVVVYAATFPGGAPRPVAKFPGRAPRLTADGKRALYLTGPWTSSALWSCDADGKHASRVAGGGTTAWNGAWSPDGKRIAYTFGDSTHVLQIHVAKKDGSDDRALTHGTAADGSAQMPAWAPDGKRIAYQVSQRMARTAHLWIFDPDSSNATKLAPHDTPYLDEAPAWFPDGKRLAFQSTRGGAMDIWVMNADGTAPRQVTGLPPAK